MMIKPFMTLLLVSALLTLGACGSDSGGSDRRDPFEIVERQPFLDPDDWGWVAPIDGGGYCGPASLYHIIHYYGDSGDYDWITAEKTWAGTRLHIPDISAANPMFIDNTAFALFIQPDPDLGSGWIDLKKVTNLFRSKNILDRMYRAFTCTSYTEIEEVTARELRLSYIREHILSQGIPVVVHLESSIPFYGHYITLIGHDPENGDVYYVDSLKHDKGIQTVAEDDFLEGWFYSAGLLYTARWDGEWMAFWHTELGTICDRCGD